MPGFSSEAALIDVVQQQLVRKFSRVTKDQISTTVAQLMHGSSTAAYETLFPC